jgi:hypothetical protein
MTVRIDDLMKVFRDLVIDLAETGAFTLKEFENAMRFQFVCAHLEQYKQNQSRAARALVIHRNTLRRICIEMRKAGVEPGRREPKRREPGQPAITMGEKREKRSA